ncbi:P1 family peptidase [Streptomyces sp. NPDC050619]|uniref:P1 family peptidase n=1 Tax=Streptomyces sp. NPDC050619 TaxID=3157214 RepID=UPI00343AE89E
MTERRPIPPRPLPPHVDVVETSRTAACAHDGFARSLNPVHTLVDGDTVFGPATGRTRIPGDDPDSRVTALMRIQAAAEVMALAVLDGVRSASGVTTPTGTFPCYTDLMSS